jgi:hypothetical protein
MRRLIIESKQSVGGADATYRLYETPGIAQELYIDGMQGLTVVGPVVKINCFTRGAQTPAQTGAVEEREVVCRLVMGVDTFLAITEWLRSVESELRPKLAAPQPIDENRKGS